MFHSTGVGRVCRPGKPAEGNRRSWSAGARHCCCLALLGAVVLSGAGCSGLGGPDYQRPETPDKAQWSGATEVSPEATIQPDWWAQFNDPYLDQLIEQSVADAPDLQVLSARLDVAQAGIGAEKSALKPRLSSTLSTDYQKTGSGPTTKQESTQQSLSWEVDIWGKAQKGISAKKAEYQATEADYRAGYLTLVSDVANAYFEIRQLDEQMAAQTESLENAERILAIYKAQYAEALVPKTKLLSQEAEVHGLRRQLLDQQRQRVATENSLASLLGKSPGEFSVPVKPLSASVDELEVPAGLPSDLLSRRPDVVAQEYRVLAAYNLVGQARLARLPSLSLTASAGSSSSALSDVLQAWTFGLSRAISIPIFDPSIQAQIKTTEASQKVAEAEYRRTVIKAFEEVETTLNNLDSRKAQRQLLLKQVEDLSIVQQQVEARLREGFATQLEIFEAERTLLSTRMELLSNKKAILTETITLYKALGGGWPKEVVGQAQP
jgi:NodT family efflux transporter outer membrane factor (OMF) lipoprotein